MHEIPNPEMFSLARDIREYTQTQLAEVTGIDQGTLSKYESGLRSIPDKDLDLIADTLGFPRSFFYLRGKRYGAESGQLFHRRQRRIRVGDLKRIDAMLNVLRFQMERVLVTSDRNTEANIPRLFLREYEGDVEDVAATVRAALKLPYGPIKNMTSVLEDASCLVFSYDFNTDKIDENTQWIEPLPPLILVNKSAPGDRLRMSLAHALGHLVLHHNREPFETMEDEANQFAAAFLMPSEDIAPELEPVTLEHLAQLKSTWKVSIQALIVRAKDIGLINDTRSHSLFQMLSRAGWRKNEPFPIPQEKPRKVEAELNYYRKYLKYNESDLTELVGLYEKDFREWYSASSDSVPNLRLVKKPSKGDEGSDTA